MTDDIVQASTSEAQNQVSKSQSLKKVAVVSILIELNFCIPLPFLSDRFNNQKLHVRILNVFYR
jgi:hypothetical protein